MEERRKLIFDVGASTKFGSLLNPRRSDAYIDDCVDYIVSSRGNKPTPNKNKTVVTCCTIYTQVEALLGTCNF